MSSSKTSVTWSQHSQPTADLQVQPKIQIEAPSHSLRFNGPPSPCEVRTLPAFGLYPDVCTETRRLLLLHNALRRLDRRNDIRPQAPLLLVGVVTAYNVREDIELELEPAMRARAEARLGLDAVFIDDAEAANWP